MIHRFDILSIFPNLFDSYLSESLVEKALARKLFEVQVHDLRNWAHNKHKAVDDLPYGGGPGMVYKPEPLSDAIEEIKKDYKKGRVIYLSCQGSVFNQKKAKSLLNECEEILLVCGRYEGIDQRVIESQVDEEISVGDFVLAGGEVPALVLMDALIRLIPGVIGKAESLDEESIEWGLLEYPHYTRPENFKGMEVPKVLLSGNHAEIKRWRLQKAIKITQKRRPELLQSDDIAHEIKVAMEMLQNFEKSGLRVPPKAKK